MKHRRDAVEREYDIAIRYAASHDRTDEAHELAIALAEYQTMFKVEADQ